MEGVALCVNRSARIQPLKDARPRAVRPREAARSDRPCRRYQTDGGNGGATSAEMLPERRSRLILRRDRQMSVERCHRLVYGSGLRQCVCKK